jgi:tetratricopeptide (TPR) repeat protein
MATTRVFLGTCLVASLFCSVHPASAAVYSVIIKGKVTMSDGTPPPFTVAVERVCTDLNGSAPGPLANKKGEYTWRMDVDPFNSRKCVIQATHAGYTSTAVDISSLDGATSAVTTLETLVLTTTVVNPYSITTTSSSVPSRSGTAWKAAMKGLDDRNLPEAAAQLKMVVAESPKFAIGWHALGVVLESQDKGAEARDAYQHAIDADPKMLAAYMTLTRASIKAKDWATAAKTADGLIKVDTKKVYPEIYLHQAVARYQLKDLDGAAASAQDAIKLRIPRAEYVLGRTLEAKGDAAGAREHISKYLEQDKNTPDAGTIRSHLENIGKPGAVGVEPDLEQLN